MKALETHALLLLCCAATLCPAQTYEDDMAVVNAYFPGAVVDSAGGRVTIMAYRQLPITELPPQIGLLTGLRRLDVWGDSITTLPPEIGNLARLQILWATNNRISSLPAEFSRLDSLTSLFLTGNRIATLPDSVFDLSRLSHLLLDWNSLAEVPLSVCRLGSLRELYVTGNGLAGLPDELGDAPRLSLLNADHNAIAALPERILARSFTGFTVEDNCLCSLSSVADSFLNSYSPRWRLSQRCTTEVAFVPRYPPGVWPFDTTLRLSLSGLPETLSIERCGISIVIEDYPPVMDGPWQGYEWATIANLASRALDQSEPLVCIFHNNIGGGRYRYPLDHFEYILPWGTDTLYLMPIAYHGGYMDVRLDTLPLLPSTPVTFDGSLGLWYRRMGALHVISCNCTEIRVQGSRDRPWPTTVLTVLDARGRIVVRCPVSPAGIARLPRPLACGTYPTLLSTADWTGTARLLVR